MRERTAQTRNGFHRGILAFYTAILRLCRRLPVPTVRRQWLYAVILMCCQGGITFTGSLVRVTGSGLGCPTWPQCQPGSLVPESGAAPAVHQAIEFGNRLLTFVVSVAAILAFLAVLRAARRSSIQHLAFLQGIGIIVQAVLGGITVHMDLAWWMVMAHFLPSMLLTFFAAVLVVKVGEPDDGRRRSGMPAPLRWATWISAASLAVVLITGTMTTSSGPHAGDDAIKESDRLQIPLIEMANLHAHGMYLYLGVTVGLLAGLFAVRVDRRILTVSGWLIVGIVLQAVVGIVQYNMNVPRWTVPLHVIGSAILTAATGLLWAMRFRRGDAALDRDFDNWDASTGPAELTGSPRDATH
ncbi:heme A synthase [uncultured Corynebacterium sp.]|uniref:COX15/CtaA family protein n=1 Tax=uncultured Corynebacterium sp. TaxID=159447 RepID=UPI0025CDF696|nr:heme A synthase [uncultured Corynebacterium sp.]